METKLNRAFRDAWTDALRSGEYEQGRGWLCAEGKFCCLGVGLEVEGISRKEKNSCGIVSFDSVDTSLPASANRRWGLNYLDEGALISLNDTGKSFSEIADYIDTLPVEDAVMAGDAS